MAGSTTASCTSCSVPSRSRQLDLESLEILSDATLLAEIREAERERSKRMTKKLSKDEALTRIRKPADAEAARSDHRTSRLRVGRAVTPCRRHCGCRSTWAGDPIW